MKGEISCGILMNCEETREFGIKFDHQFMSVDTFMERRESSDNVEGNV